MLLRNIKKWIIKETENTKNFDDMIKVLTYYLKKSKEEKEKSTRNYNTTFKKRRRTWKWYKP